MRAQINRGRTYTSLKVTAGRWHIDFLRLDRCQRADRLFLRLPAGHGWRLSFGPLALQAYRPDRFNQDHAAAMA